MSDDLSFHAASHTRILITLTTDFDPTDATLGYRIEDTTYPTEWLGDPLKSGDRWRRKARTLDYFRGPDSTLTTGVLLDVGRHPAATVTTVGSDVVVDDTATVVVSR